MTPLILDHVIKAARSNHCSELVLFGSRAVGLETRTSDWDVLVVGDSRIHVPNNVDQVVISRDRLISPNWLGSELAGHVVKYGEWLIGEPSWVKRVASSERAVDRKADRIVRRFLNLERNWSALHAAYREKILVAIRRDLQRLQFLRDGIAVPPTAALDSQWSAEVADPRKRWETLFDDNNHVPCYVQDTLLKLFSAQTTGAESTRNRIHAHSRVPERSLRTRQR